MVNLDPPEHTTLRGRVNAAFTAPSMERLDHRIRRSCDHQAPHVGSHARPVRASRAVAAITRGPTDPRHRSGRAGSLGDTRHAVPANRCSRHRGRRSARPQSADRLAHPPPPANRIGPARRHHDPSQPPTGIGTVGAPTTSRPQHPKDPSRPASRNPTHESTTGASALTGGPGYQPPGFPRCDQPMSGSRGRA